MSERGSRRTLVGMVVSDQMDKTVVVRVERLVKDPRYKKQVRRYSRFLAHDEANDCGVGDRVQCFRFKRVAPPVYLHRVAGGVFCYRFFFPFLIRFASSCDKS